MVKKRSYDTSASTPDEAYESYLDTVKDPVEKLIARCEKEFKTQMKTTYATVTVSVEDISEEGVIDEVARVYRGKGWTVSSSKKSITLKKYIASTGSSGYD